MSFIDTYSSKLLLYKTLKWKIEIINHPGKLKLQQALLAARTAASISNLTYFVI